MSLAYPTQQLQDITWRRFMHDYISRYIEDNTSLCGKPELIEEHTRNIALRLQAYFPYILDCIPENKLIYALNDPVTITTIEHLVHNASYDLPVKPNHLIRSSEANESNSLSTSELINIMRQKALMLSEIDRSTEIGDTGACAFVILFTYPEVASEIYAQLRTKAGLDNSTEYEGKARSYFNRLGSELAAMRQSFTQAFCGPESSSTPHSPGQSPAIA